VFVEWRDGYWVAVNYSSVNFELDMIGNKKNIFGELMLAPGSVTVWK